MTLGEKISWLRKQKGLSQGDLADKLGVSRQSVSKWETDASVPDLDRLVVLSRLFGITLDELVCGEGVEGGVELPEFPQPSEQRPAAPSQGRRVFGGVLLASMLALTVVTARSFSSLREKAAPVAVGLTAVLWAAAILAWRLKSLLFLLFVEEDGRIGLPGLVAGLLQGGFAAGQTAALAAAVTLTLALVRGRRVKTSG